MDGLTGRIASTDLLVVRGAVSSSISKPTRLLSSITELRSRRGSGPALAYSLYSPKCVEGELCELRLYGVLRSSPKHTQLAHKLQRLAALNHRGLLLHESLLPNREVESVGRRMKSRGPPTYSRKPLLRQMLRQDGPFRRQLSARTTAESSR